MSTPIEMMLQGVTWVPVPEGGTRDAMHQGDIPYATHSGVLDLMGHQFRVYRLSDGNTVINADDLNAFFSIGRLFEGDGE